MEILGYNYEDMKFGTPKPLISIDIDLNWKGWGQQFANIALWGDGQLAIYLNWFKEVNINPKSGLFNTKIVPNII